MKKAIRLWLLAALVLLACERETNVDIPQTAPRLVVHAQQAQGLHFQVRIERSIGVTETISTQNPDQFVVPGAFVTLRQNEVLFDTLRYNASGKQYSGTRPALQGFRYSMEASAQGFDKAEATSFLPLLVQPASVRYKRRVRTNVNQGDLDEISVTFTDDGSKTDHYLFRIRYAYGNFAYCVLTNDKDVERLVYSEPLYTDECLDGDRLLMKDTYFNGATKTVVFYAESSSMDPVDLQGRRLRPTLELLTINEEFFRYVKSVHKYESALDNPFAEPANVLTNVKNGYGFFTAFALSIDTLR